jgi:hypothetical protein
MGLQHQKEEGKCIQLEIPQENTCSENGDFKKGFAYISIGTTEYSMTL